MMYRDLLKTVKIADHVIKFDEGLLNITENMKGKSWDVSISGIEDISILFGIFNGNNSFSCELVSKRNVIYHGNAIIGGISMNSVKILGDGALNIK